MNLGTTFIQDTFAEAFGMSYVRLLVTAYDTHWLNAAVCEVTGYSASVIACDAEAGLERLVGPTPVDGYLQQAHRVHQRHRLARLDRPVRAPQRPHRGVSAEH